MSAPPTFARSKPEFMPIRGDFVNSVPIRGRLSDQSAVPRFRSRSSRTTVLEAIEAQEFPLPLLVQRLQPERSADSSPLFNTFFSLLRFHAVQGFALLYGDDSDDPVEIGGTSPCSFPDRARQRPVRPVAPNGRDRRTTFGALSSITPTSSKKPRSAAHEEFPLPSSTAVTQ